MVAEPITGYYAAAITKLDSVLDQLAALHKMISAGGPESDFANGLKTNMAGLTVVRNGMLARQYDANRAVGRVG